MKNFFKKRAASLKEFSSAVKNGDIWVKLSLLIMGMGYFGRKQILKGILMLLLEVGVITSFVSVFLPYMSKLSTLGSAKRNDI